MDDPKRFDRPVVVEDWRGTVRILASTLDAAHFLMNAWPVGRGDRHVEAIDACIEVLRGERPPAEARAAFVAAAREAEISVERQPRLH
jgi:hypothetical protein